MRFVDAGLSLSEAANACGVSERTFRRWEADNRAPLAVLKLLRLLSGQLNLLDPAFNRFWIRQGRLFNDQFPEGLAAGDLLAANYTRQERDILRSEIGRLRAQIAAVTQPPARSISNGRSLVVPAYCLTGEKISPQTAQNGTPHIRANLPRWVGFSARAGPHNLATNNPQNPKTDADRLSLSTYAGVKGRMPSPAWIKLAQFNTGEGAKQLPAPDCQNSASGTNELSRQACRHLPI
ncbi:MAG: helix-turn-helix transcriptional regulator, partial [Halothiobacillus sp.]|nr:helix-turn-helix transcriptional regulator [Halothiobacillus sp.]